MGLGQLKAQASGQIELLVFLPTKVPETVKIPESYDAVEMWLRNMGEDQMKSLSDVGALLYVLHLPWRVLYLPPGVVMLEKTRSGNLVFCFSFFARSIAKQKHIHGNVCYGLRKAVMPQHDDCHAGYQWLVVAMTAAKRQAGKMIQALDMMKQKTEVIEAVVEAAVEDHGANEAAADQEKEKKEAAEVENAAEEEKAAEEVEAEGVEAERVEAERVEG